MKLNVFLADSFSSVKILNHWGATYNKRLLTNFHFVRRSDIRDVKKKYKKSFRKGRK